MEKPQIIITGDGSTSLFRPDLDETYHSRHGALQESMHVFIQMGLHKIAERNPSEISVLEVGMGTGLNVWLTAMESQKIGIPIVMTTLEPFPLEPLIVKELNFTENQTDQDQELFNRIHQAEWEVPVAIDPSFILKKSRSTLQEYETVESFDLVYYDAFAPAKQKEMWDASLIRKVTTWCNFNAVFVTYCATGQLKRDLLSSGFEVESLPGPPGKREMVRGIWS